MQPVSNKTEPVNIKRSLDINFLRSMELSVRDYTLVPAVCKSGVPTVLPERVADCVGALARRTPTR